MNSRGLSVVNGNRAPWSCGWLGQAVRCIFQDVAFMHVYFIICKILTISRNIVLFHFFISFPYAWLFECNALNWKAEGLCFIYLFISCIFCTRRPWRSPQRGGFSVINVLLSETCHTVCASLLPSPAKVSFLHSAFSPRIKCSSLDRCVYI